MPTEQTQTEQTQLITQEHNGLRFFNCEKAVTFEQIQEDKTYLAKNLRVGSEKETAHLRNPRQFNATDSYERLGEEGIIKVYPDGSIKPYGQEIVEIGSNASFNEILKRDMAIEKKIRVVVGMKGYNESCSNHITLALGQTRSTPEVYVLNMYQIFRLYASALFWLGSGTFEEREAERELIEWHNNHSSDGGDWEINPHRICRRKGGAYFASPSRQINETPLDKGLIELHLSKYTALNLEKLSISNGKIGVFIIESRITDRLPSSYANTALKFLYKAMFLKAVSLSEFGVLEIGNNQKMWRKNKLILNRLIVGKELSQEDKTFLKEHSLRLLKFVASELKSMDLYVHDILKKIADKPVSQLYREGKTAVQMDAFYKPKVHPEHDLEKRIRQYIIKGQCLGKNKVEWLNNLAAGLSITLRQAEYYLNSLADKYKLENSDNILILVERF